MGMALLTNVGKMHDALELLESMEPPVRENGPESEARVLYYDFSWKRYLALDKALGDDRSVPRLYYLDGELEIMSTSDEHERIKKWFADLLALYFDEIETEIMPRGQATMVLPLNAAAAEPDEAWCFGGEKTFPDLVLEIALSSGGVRKLDLHRRFGVPEVWIWRKGKLEVHVLAADGSGYERVEQKSRLLARVGLRPAGALRGNPRLARGAQSFSHRACGGTVNLLRWAAA